MSSVHIQLTFMEKDRNLIERTVGPAQTEEEDEAGIWAQWMELSSYEFEDLGTLVKEGVLFFGFICPREDIHESMFFSDGKEFHETMSHDGSAFITVEPDGSIDKTNLQHVEKFVTGLCKVKERMRKGD